MKDYTIFAVNLIKTIANMKLKNEVKQEFVDPETGELITQITSKTFSIKTTSEKFYMQFYNLIENYIELTDTCKNVLAVICSKIEWDKNCLSLNPAIREDICTLCKIKYQTLANTLHLLKDKGIINIIKGNCYVNPEYFWKGSLKTREKALKDGLLSINIEFEQE